MGITEHRVSKMSEGASPTLGELTEAYKDVEHYVVIIPDPRRGTAQCYAVLDEAEQELAFETLKGMAKAQLRRIRSGGL